MKNKITILEIIVIMGVISVFALFFSPKFTNSPEKLQQATVRANVQIATSSIKSIFALKNNKEEDMAKIAGLIAETLNKTTKNPIDRKTDAYIVNSVSMGAVSFIPDASTGSITIKGYAQDTESPLITEVISK